MRLRYVLWIVLLSFLTLPQSLFAQTVSIPISSSNWFFSPYNWTAPGSIQIDGLSMPEIITNEPGAYFTLSFADSKQVVLNLDTINIVSVGGMTSMVVQWRVDSTLYPPHTLALADTRLTLATDLGPGTHTVQFWLVSSDYRQDRWSKTTSLVSGFLGPAQSLRITGVALDAGVNLIAPVGVRPKRILFFGDSITEGAGLDPADDASQTYVTLCAQLLNAEYGVIANPGQGWACNIAPASGVPTFGTAFDQYYGQTPRFPFIAGTSTPDYVIVNMGTNDAIYGADPGAVTTAAMTFLQQIRSDLPSSQIFIVVPFGGFEALALQSAVSQYLLSNPTDTKVSLIDLGATAQAGLMGQVPGGSPESYDGIHPNAATHRALGFQLTAALQTALGSNDINGDGKSDLILQNVASNQIADWFQNDTVVQNGAFVPSVPDGDYQVAGSGDFNGDGKPDYVFQNRVTNQIAIWYMNGTSVVGGSLLALTPDSNYKIVGVGDFNGDGKPDIVFQNQTTNQIVFWFMDGSTVIGGAVLPQVPGAGYQVVGVGDFNRDGQKDLLFQNTTSGALVLWYMNGTQYADGAVVSATPEAGYRVEAIADFDGDGRPDVALRDPNGNIVLWHLDGAKVYSTKTLSTRLDSSFRIAGPR
ncbi:MAG: hypothetical protein JWL77_5862 [Chthonomonadaceae bacterium]|nr:hypothetical protein [Chthonomonadaceae bacterium]